MSTSTDATVTDASRVRRGARPVSRRAFLRRAAILAAAAGVETVFAGSPIMSTPGGAAAVNAVFLQAIDVQTYVPAPPATPPDPNQLQVFTPDQAALVDALVSRIIPGTPNDPGAHEAGVVTYIDNMLAFNDGYNEATYLHGPWAQIYTGDSPPPGGTAETVWIKAGQIERYGYQSRLSPVEVYQIGLVAVDRYAQQTFGKPFVQLSPQQQDQFISDMAGNKIKDFDPRLGAVSFFHTLRRHTSEGMFSDPAYGGNRGMVGWMLVGFPGMQRGYTVDDIHNSHFQRPPQSLAEMPAMNPGDSMGEKNAILPLSGSDPDVTEHVHLGDSGDDD